ncbi:MAG TPA: HAMP domain-containing protein [Desulfuromonadales bacterium]|nr:HAMP domain-containing protein [Desulfuromonadales bacterium]
MPSVPSHLRPTLTVSILAFLGCLLLLTWLLFSLLAFKTAANDLYSQKGEHARTLLTTYINQLPEQIPTYPEGFMSPETPSSGYVQKLAEDASFARLSLLDRNGKLIFSSGRDDVEPYLPFKGIPDSATGSFIRPDGSSIAHIIAVKRNGLTVGKAGLLLSLNSEKARLNRTRQMMIAYFALDFILLLWLGSFVLSRIVVNPINKLLAATEKIIGGVYGQRLHVSGSAELVGLADAFNRMSATLQGKDRQVAEQMQALEQANHELSQAREESIRTEKMASIGLLAAGMGHEMGTPLASIMGYADLIAGEDPHNPALQDYAGRISADCARIDRIVRGLLDYSRPRAASNELADIQQVVSATLELLAQQGAFKQLQISMQIEPGLPHAVADPYQLQQILINLLLNSRDAVLPGGELEVSARLDSAEICIDVRDNGSGIAEEHLKHIFDPFFTTKPPGKGTGLGLALSARIVEGFGGRIIVTSRPGVGSCFSVWLPVAAQRTGA